MELSKHGERGLTFFWTTLSSFLDSLCLPGIVAELFAQIGSVGHGASAANPQAAEAAIRTQLSKKCGKM